MVRIAFQQSYYMQQRVNIINAKLHWYVSDGRKFAFVVLMTQLKTWPERCKSQF